MCWLAAIGGDALSDKRGFGVFAKARDSFGFYRSRGLSFFDELVAQGDHGRAINNFEILRTSEPQGLDEINHRVPVGLPGVLQGEVVKPDLLLRDLGKDLEGRNGAVPSVGDWDEVFIICCGLHRSWRDLSYTHSFIKTKSIPALPFSHNQRRFTLQVVPKKLLPF